MGPSPWQLLIVLAIVLILFGTKRLKNIGGDLGSAIKGFKKSIKDETPKDKDGSEQITEANRVEEGEIIDAEVVDKKTEKS